MLKRNSTSFPVQINIKLKDLYETYKKALNESDSWASNLRYYQYLVRAVMTNSEFGIGQNGNARGLLVYGGMGIGKTRLAVAVALTMIHEKRECVVLLAKSLQKNFKKTIKEMDEILELENSEKHFKYVSMDAYNASEQLESNITLDNKLLIVDEAHNFFRGIINSSSDSTNARKMYNTIMSAKNLRILFLTGTPCAKDPFELVPCFNMLANEDLLPTNFDTFNKLYIDMKERKIINREHFQNRIMGLVSHVSHDKQHTMDLSKEENLFPEEKKTIIERVEMNEEQYKQYLLAREKEENEIKFINTSSFGKALTLPTSERKSASTYYVKSRSISNVYESISPKFDAIIKNIDSCDGNVLVYSQFIQSGLIPFGDELKKRGWKEFNKQVMGGYDKTFDNDIDKNVIEYLLNKSELRDIFQEKEKIKIKEVSSFIMPRVNPWYEFDEIPAFEYRDNKSFIPNSSMNARFNPTFNMHRGQRKLFISELQCLTYFLKQHDKPATVVYAGAAAGYHIPILVSLFPNVLWYLYDPAPFGIKETDKIKIFNVYFTDDVAKEWTNKVDIFICDIRLVPEGKVEGWSSEFEDQVGKDMKMQETWTKLMKPRMGAMLKFRPPYIDNKTMADDYIDYIKGKILIQTWPPVNSTEGRLIIEAEDVDKPPMHFDSARYQNACAVHNLTRSWRTYYADDELLNVKGFDRCFDCANEAHAWRMYRGINKNAKSVVYYMNMMENTLKQVLFYSEKSKCMHGYMNTLSSAKRIKEVLKKLCKRTGGEDSIKSFAIISGDVSEKDRELIIGTFNKPENMHGELIKALLISKTGAEGLDLKCVRQTHQMEPYWDKARDDQVKARAVRQGSHLGLPEDERNVQSYLYIAKENMKIWKDMDEKLREKQTVDEMFHQRAITKFDINQEFRILLQESCIECTIFNYGNCNVCTPTGETLFHKDPTIDVTFANPCRKLQEKQIDVKTIELDGETYYYTKDKDSSIGYTFYVKNKELGGFVKADPSKINSLLESMTD